MIGINKIDHNDFHARAVRFSFSNGITASVIFETGLYNGNDPLFQKFKENSKTVGLAVFYDGRFITWKIFPDFTDDAIAYMSIDELPDFLAECRNYKPS